MIPQPPQSPLFPYTTLFRSVYPYNAGATKMDNLMPAWAHEGGVAKLLERLADRATRKRITDECLVDGERWGTVSRSEEHTSELQSHVNLVCRLLLEKKKKKK